MLETSSSNDRYGSIASGPGQNYTVLIFNERFQLQSQPLTLLCLALGMRAGARRKYRAAANATPHMLSRQPHLKSSHLA